MSVILRVVVEGQPGFEEELERLGHRGDTDLAAAEPVVREVIADVRREGDRALRRYIEKFEQRQPEQLLLRDWGGAQALTSLPQELQSALRTAADRIRVYHERQAQALGGFETHSEGITLASRVAPLSSVAVYAPGGKAQYPSSVLMTAVIARVAGVPEIILITPDSSPVVRAAAQLSGVTAILDCGGAQAVAAAAYGTESVPAVDKIVGPGNIYVTAAKRLVYGDVDIDGLAGPSEILVIADESASPAVVAADLLSQAEHDEAAYPLLLTTRPSLVEQVQAELDRQLPSLPKLAIASRSVAERGRALVVKDRSRLWQVASQLAVEHVAVQVQQPRELADQIANAGAIFIGSSTPEAAGDYLAGPSHVLPTGGAARFAPPLGVYDFIQRTSLIAYEAPALEAQREAITTLARAEGLEAHARAVEVRTKR